MPFLKTFNVEAETTAGQHICVSGNCPALGNWEVNSAFVLTNSNVTHVRNNKTYHVWSGIVHLPADREILFRYFNACIYKSDDNSVNRNHVFVNSWESHYEPRSVKYIDETQISSNDNISQCDIFGLYLSDKQQISKGFLTTECAIQFKFYDNPINFWNSKLQNNKDNVSVKMTPKCLSKQSASSGDTYPDFLVDDMNSQTFDDFQKTSGWPFVECLDIPGNKNFQYQNLFGTSIKKNAFHLFQTKIFNFSDFVYLFDIYLHKETSEEPPYHFGFTYILPSNMKYSDGIIMSPITSIRGQKPIGELKIEYLIIKPAKDIHCNFEKVPNWNSPYTPLDIGHRGSGTTFRQKCSHIRENTIASLKEAANNGADFVEFDVQLTKDLIPIIYHDFKVSMAIKSKTNVLNKDVEMIQVPLKDFDFAQLQKLKIYHNKEPYSLPDDHFLNDPRSDYQPFPKLEIAFTEVPINIGFNIELKWTMKLQDETFELDYPFDMNLFVDIILKTVFEFAESRSIVFSCFHPDICTMLKMKQNRYAVLFLTQGVTTRYPPYADPRCHTIQNAVHQSSSHDFLGVNAHSEDLLRDHTQINLVKEAGLALFCWGEDNNSKEVMKKFKQLGVNAVIYDELDRNDLMNKKNSEIFITKNHCEQKKIFLSEEQSINEEVQLTKNSDSRV